MSYTTLAPKPSTKRCGQNSKEKNKPKPKNPTHKHFCIGLKETNPQLMTTFIGVFPASHNGHKSQLSGMIKVAQKQATKGPIWKQHYNSKAPKVQGRYLDDFPHHSSYLQYGVNSLPKRLLNPREQMQPWNETITACQTFSKDYSQGQSFLPW